MFLKAINTFIYSHEIIRLLTKQLYPPNIELIILGSEPRFRVMAVAVAVPGPEDMTFILCVSTPQDTVSCKVSIFIHWVYCFQQKIPLPNATTSRWGEKSQQAKCQGMCPYYSLCMFLSVMLLTGSFANGKCSRLLSNINVVSIALEAATGWASGTGQSSLSGCV